MACGVQDQVRESFMRVLVAYDGSEYAEAAINDLGYAGLPNDTEVRIFRVVDRHIDPVSEAASEDVCERLQRQFRAWTILMETATGDPAAMILKRASEWPADLIVVGTHGRSGIGRIVLGSVSTAVSHEARCSVRVGRAIHRSDDNSIRLIVAHDGSPEADAVVNEVCGRSWPTGTQVRVVSVIQSLVTTRADEMAGIAPTVRDINAEQRQWLEYLANESERKLVQAGLIASSSVMEGEPKESLVNEAGRWGANTIFMGARGLGRIERLLLGSVSSAVMTRAPSTVEIVRSLRSK
jgi:nucleotide-binding universal stress UspA family protein